MNTNNIFADPMDVSEGEHDIPVTPNTSTSKKRLRKASKEITDDNEGDFEDNNNNNNNSTEDITPKKKAKPLPKTPGSKGDKSSTSKKKKPTKPSTPGKAIPRSYDECGPADRQLLDMRDSGSSWPEIRSAWEKLTGEKTGASTLPNRYVRLKSNFTVVQEEDLPRLLEAKRSVEEAFEKGKWGMVAEAVEKMGGTRYGGDALQKQYKKMMLGQGVMPPSNVRDKDFEAELDEEE
ncbi:hypothetical protein KC343_g8507 [Hortaea werneckii]|uniref:Uncharacterized protein n=1 Tax=Hortaea werneckii TaxID=91943 RepID=A0A3M7EAM5_HORWE|nr:hypothetical protein KC352_g16490 [Hortaea werneckii]KAI7561892.1 hypothetical protein KC317_g8779 [Hortaea werneckii]KAI7611176.1 hypothetical protein KC346_g8422 [Hortaea werneckii]KAI7619999.1 hypothetical protein KC343_g8507 [Hortaea werneckii]KAI7661866.1 hypothetical protein KC319_g8291 [Hortaea werneckii]